MFSKEKITVAYTIEKCEKCGMQKKRKFSPMQNNCRRTNCPSENAKETLTTPALVSMKRCCDSSCNTFYRVK